MSTSSEEETGWETIAVGKLKVWKPQEEGECRRMEPQMIKNNSVVQIMWRSTGIFKPAAFENPSVF